MTRVDRSYSPYKEVSRISRQGYDEVAGFLFI